MHSEYQLNFCILKWYFFYKKKIKKKKKKIKIN